MHIHKFAEIAEFNEKAIGGTLPETEKYREFFNNLHPMQFLSASINAPVYEISYSYTTSRGNARKGKKYIIVNSIHDDVEIEIEMKFDDWIKEHNRKNNYRTISNVKILEIITVAYAVISLQN